MIVSTYNSGKEDGKWVYGLLCEFVGKWTIRQFEYDRADYVSYEVDPETVCQYTGLTDKNGNKIFEGDIVKAPFLCGVTKKNITGIVEYKKGIFNFKHTKEEYGRQLLGYVDDIDVIGNIFDNPELLEVQE